MGGFFAFYAFGIYLSNPITAAAVGVAGPLVSAATVWLVTRQAFDPGFGVALVLTVTGGIILASGSLLGRGEATFRGGEIIVLLSNSVWTVYSLKAQAWFDRASQLHRAYVASLSALGWLILFAGVLVALGRSRQPFGVDDGWVWTQLLATAVLASGLGGYYWNVGASRLGVPIASLWVNLVPFFAVLWAMAYGFMPNAYQIVGGLVALSGVVYMQARKLRIPIRA
jgi:drug/metabolite transporter (DMT)-like permease